MEYVIDSVLLRITAPIKQLPVPTYDILLMTMFYITTECQTTNDLIHHYNILNVDKY